jgi:hypothetical protein
VIELLDKLKTSGVKRFGMAAEAGGKKWFLKIGLK